MIDIQGHRGCRGLLPENSLPAFKKAIELGVHTLELDVVISMDNKVIVSHEPYMNSTICKTPNGESISKEDEMHYNLYTMTHDSIKQFDCGSKVHPRFKSQQLQSVYKPSLEEVIELAEALNSKIKYNIELKAKPPYDGIYTPKPEEFVRLVLDQLKQNNVLVRSNLQSFDLRILEEIKIQEPAIDVALLVDENETIEIKLSELSYSPEIISPYFKLLTRSNVKHYRSQGYKIIPWTVNDISNMEVMISHGVDGIITDYPDSLITLLSD